MYRSPSKLLTSHDLNILTNLSNQNILAGDFNAKHLAWGRLAQNPAGNKLHSYCRMHNIEVSAPTEPMFYRSTNLRQCKDIFDIVISKNVNISPHINVLGEVLDLTIFLLNFNSFQNLCSLLLSELTPHILTGNNSEL